MRLVIAWDFSLGSKHQPSPLGDTTGKEDDCGEGDARAATTAVSGFQWYWSYSISYFASSRFMRWNKAAFWLAELEWTGLE